MTKDDKLRHHCPCLCIDEQLLPSVGRDTPGKPLTVHALHNQFLNKEAPEAKKAAIYLIKKHTAVTNRQIGEHFGGLSYSGVAKITERFSAALKRDKKLRKRIADLEKGM